MRDEILDRLDKRIGRRGFLKGSGLAVATIVGAAMAAPLFAQEPQQQQDAQKKDDKDAKKDDRKTDDKKADDNSDSETKIDADGHEYRVCPQCGGNMYRQGRTWTCENCGYSYVE